MWVQGCPAPPRLRELGAGGPRAGGEGCTEGAARSPEGLRDGKGHCQRDAQEAGAEWRAGEGDDHDQGPDLCAGGQDLQDRARLAGHSMWRRGGGKDAGLGARSLADYDEKHDDAALPAAACHAEPAGPALAT